MRLLQLLSLLRRVPVRDLINFPSDLSDSEDVRRWVMAAIETGVVLAERTVIEIDDTILDFAADLVDRNDSWALIHGVVLAVMEGRFTAEHSVECAEELQEVTECAFNPMMIFAIIQAVQAGIKILKALRDARKQRQISFAV